MHLYGRRSSINVQKVLWCLGELGAIAGRDYQRIDAGLHFGVVDTPTYLDLNPNGLVPTFVEGDFVLWESNAISRYLAGRAHDENLFPSDLAVRARVEQWMDWQSNTLWAALREAFIGLTRTPEPLKNAAAIKASYAEGGRLIAMLEDVLSHQAYIVGENLTLADIGVGLSVHRWFDMAKNFPDQVSSSLAVPNVHRWCEALRARETFQDTIAENDR